MLTSASEAAAFLQRALPELEVEFDPEDVIESAKWWYIPFGWIGCAGFIIDKDGGYINQLGSCHSLDECCWGHSNGIKYKYADLTVLRVHNLDATLATLMKMGNSSPFSPTPNKQDKDGNLREFWTIDELRAEIITLPKTFPDQVLWFTILALHEARDKGYFDFEVAEGSHDREFALKPLD
ncbi:hypothetical protein [Luteolibacter sp. Populi]|uniref:hypothetical protein n=1 Tax=Luteolibacter sp. Populi TaxID=3230487 RepID=UPI003466B2DD